MAATVILSSNATLELLHLFNYDEWSLLVRTYLIAEGLWDVVDATATTPNNGYLRKKNAKALHVIQMSCRNDVLGFICNCKTAKDAWETLAKRLKPKCSNKDIDGMAATIVPRGLVILPALDINNYEDWRFWVKEYLLAENLWEMAEGTWQRPKPEDKVAIVRLAKQGARALHVIILFCGEDAKSCIKDIDTARDAWNTLAKKFGPPEIFEILGLGGNSRFTLSNDKTSSDDDGIADWPRAEQMEGSSDLRAMMDNWQWEDVKEFIKQHPEAVRADVYEGKTPLQYAIWLGKKAGVNELLALTDKKDLDVVSNDGRTAISEAIHEYDVEIVKSVVDKNKKLLLRAVSPHANDIPLQYALLVGKPEMVDYLYSVTPFKKLKTKDAAQVVSTCLRLKRLDIPIGLMSRFPKLLTATDHSGDTLFNQLAGTRTGLFEDLRPLGIWKRLVYKCIQAPQVPRISFPEYVDCDGNVSITIPKEDTNQATQKLLISKVKHLFGRLYTSLRKVTGIDGVYQMKLLQYRTQVILGNLLEVERDQKTKKLVEKAFFQAVERGHFRIILLFYLCQHRDGPSRFISMTNENGKTLFQYAAEHRQDAIFLLMQLIEKKDMEEIIGRKDKFGNNMLHMVAKMSPATRIAHIRGAALQMQYELQWFKEVESLASPEDLNCVNYDDRTPREEFTINHRDLVEAGEKSMKETATSSSALVAALIITIMFAAAVTVPGGIDGNTGIPIYLRTKAFRIFMVADVISLCSATTSVMVFLGILTSRFAEEEFLTSLPTKLIIGFLTLFLSVGSMMVAFSTAVYIMLPGEPSIVIASTVLAGIPITSFLWMQFPFLVEVIISTYGPKFWYDYRRTQRRVQSDL